MNIVKTRCVIKKIIKAMLLLTIFSVITRCLGFVFKIYMTRVMSTTELGIYNLTISIYMVIITLVGSSIPLTISKITSRNKELQKMEDTNYSVTSSLIMTTLFSISICLMLAMSKPLITLIIGDSIGYELLLCLIPSILFTAIYSQIHGYLWGLENYFAVSIVEFVEQILRISFCIFFTQTKIIKSPTIAVAVALSTACAISTTYGLILYFKNNGKFKYKSGYFKPILKSSLPLTAVRFFASVLQPVVAIIIPIMLCNYGMSKTTALSDLGIVMGMTMPLLSIPSTIIGALCMILIPRINLNTEYETLKSQINNYLRFTLICIYIFIPIFLSLSPAICNFIFGNFDAGLYMKYCAWTIIPMGISQITTSVLNALNQEKTTFIYFTFCSILQIVLVLILPKFIGVQTMLISTGISSILQSTLNLIKIKKLTKVKVNILKNVIYYSLISIPVIILNNFTYPLLSKLLGTIGSLITICTISVIAYISLLFVFGIFDIKFVKNEIIKFKRSKIREHKNILS